MPMGDPDVPTPSKEVRRRLQAAAKSLNVPEDYFLAANRRGLPVWAANEIAPYFMALQPLAAEVFFANLLRDWEYELLNNEEGLVGWPGLLALVRADVPFDYTRELSAYYEKPVVSKPGRYGYEEVIRLHEAGVPAEYAKTMLHAQAADATLVIEAYLNGIPVEYASA